MANGEAAERAKVLLVDDDQDFLEIYWEILKTLPSGPGVHTASTGARALALLESEPFHLLIVDLNMPKMDGLQVIAIARRKYPALKVVVWTCIADEQFRARAYGMGVDQYWQKPASDQERRHFLESIDALLQRDVKGGGFRGVQSKSLVDLIQLECLSQNSTTLKINNGAFNGKIWIQSGEVFDAEAGELKGEAAFRKILGWKTGSFEMLPGDSSRPRVIFSSYQVLLLEIAQAYDEAGGHSGDTVRLTLDAPSPLMALTRFNGVQFVLSVAPEPGCEMKSWGLESPDHVSEWTQQSLKDFAALGDKLQVGQLQQVTALSPANHVALADSRKGELCVGFRSNMKSDEVRESMRNILAKWAA